MRHLIRVMRRHDLTKVKTMTKTKTKTNANTMIMTETKYGSKGTLPLLLVGLGDKYKNKCKYNDNEKDKILEQRNFTSASSGTLIRGT